MISTNTSFIEGVFLLLTKTPIVYFAFLWDLLL